MAEIKDDVLRALTLPRYVLEGVKGTERERSPSGQARPWLAPEVAADLVALMEAGVLMGDVFADWPAGPQGQPLSLMWEEVAQLTQSDS